MCKFSLILPLILSFSFFLFSVNDYVDMHMEMHASYQDANQLAIMQLIQYSGF